MQGGHGDAMHLLDGLRLSSYCHREQAQRGGDGRDQHACAHHGSHRAAKLPGRALQVSEMDRIGCAGRAALNWPKLHLAPYLDHGS